MSLEAGIGQAAGNITRRQPSMPAAALKWLIRFARRKPLGAFGGIVMVLLITAAAFAEVIAPYDPLVQNTGRRCRHRAWRTWRALISSGATCSRA